MVLSERFNAASLARRAARAPQVPKPDHEWTEDDWFGLLSELVDSGIVSWTEIANVTLGELNPPQVGTAVASKPSFQRHHPARRTWRAVRAWFYSRPGSCESVGCRTRMLLEAEHMVPRNELGDEADRLTNLQLLCKRCNAIKRPSHKNAGVTFLTAQTALMWILFTYQPRTYSEYKGLCREYGLTMADVRFQESWA